MQPNQYDSCGEGVKKSLLSHDLLRGQCPSEAMWDRDVVLGGGSGLKPSQSKAAGITGSSRQINALVTPRPLVALLGTVLEELLAGLLLQPGRALGRHLVLQLRHVLVGLKTYSNNSGQSKGWRPAHSRPSGENTVQLPVS